MVLATHTVSKVELLYRKSRVIHSLIFVFAEYYPYF